MGTVLAKHAAVGECTIERDERNKAVSSFECGITQHGRKYLINRWQERPMHRQADIHTGRQTDRQRQERYEQANLKHNVAK